MAAALTAPGVYVELTEAPPEINPVAVDVAAFVGVFERGPVGTPVRVGSWPEVEATFGRFIRNGIGAYALKGWLDNGGRVAHVVRVAAPAHETTGIAPQPAERTRSALASTDGFVPGAAAAVRDGDRTWLRLVTAVDAAAGEVTWDRPLDPEIDLLAVGVVVQTGAAVADAVLRGDGSSTAILRVRARSAGAWGNRLAVRVEHRSGAATRSVAATTPSPAESRVESTAGFAPGDVVRITQDDGAGGTRTERQVLVAVDPEASVLAWEAPLATVVPAEPLRVETETFALSVRERGRLGEVFDGLTLVPRHPRFAPAALAASALVRAEVAAGPPPAVPPLPATGDWIALAAGRDGTAALSHDDLLGDEAAGDARGLAAFATVDEPAIVAIPDLVAEPTEPRATAPVEVEIDPCDPCPPPPPPPDLLAGEVEEASARFDARQIATAQRALVEHCEARGDRIALLDPPCAAGPLATAALTEWRARSQSSYAAAYAPWLRVIDPLGGRGPSASGLLRRLPPSGHVAGLMARTDAEAGPWLAPANRVVRWVHAVDATFDDAAHGILNAAGVDVLHAQPGRGVVLLGARTVAREAEWRFVPVRRLFLMLERTLRTGLAWTAFEPAGPALDRVMAAAIAGLLEDLWERGAFAGPSPETSFFVVPGGGDRARGEVFVDVGVAVQRPIERILLRVVRLRDRLEIRELPGRSV